MKVDSHEFLADIIDKSSVWKKYLENNRGALCLRQKKKKKIDAWLNRDRHPTLHCRLLDKTNQKQIKIFISVVCLLAVEAKQPSLIDPTQKQADLKEYK